VKNLALNKTMHGTPWSQFALILHEMW